MITTGSGFERFMMCLGASVLPRAFDANENPHSTRGTEGHEHLKRVGEGMKADESLELVDEEFRDSIAAIELDDVRDVLGLTAEISFAYNPIFDTARVLGMGLHRQYQAAGCTEDEVPMTLDIAGVDNPENPTIGMVVDWKLGWQRQTPAALNWQIKGGALSLSRTYDLDLVRGQLIQLRENRPAWRDRAQFTAADLAIAATQSRERMELVLRERDRYAARPEILPEVTKGPWCRYCPSYHACPATTSLVRAAVNRDAYEDFMRGGMIERNQIAAAYRFVQDVKDPIHRLEAQIYAAAKERPVLIETFEDGSEMWLGVQEVEGNLKLDATKTRDIVRTLLDDKAADEICAYTVSQDRILDACKKRVPRGKGAEKMREVMAELKKRGASTKPVKHDVRLYKIRPHAIAAKAG